MVMTFVSKLGYEGKCEVVVHNNLAIVKNVPGEVVSIVGECEIIAEKICREHRIKEKNLVYFQVYKDDDYYSCDYVQFKDGLKEPDWIPLNEILF